MEGDLVVNKTCSSHQLEHHTTSYLCIFLLLGVNFRPLVFGNNSVPLKREEIKFSIMTISKLYDELGLGVVHQRWK
jgi:hypothetical protein